VAVILPALVPIYFVLLLGLTAGKRGVVKSRSWPGSTVRCRRGRRI
jgi:hypothetical protein